LLGAVGVAESMLRPGGTARLRASGMEELRVDVVTRGEFLDPQTPLIVIEVEGNRVVVAPRSVP
jgi:membrane-bound serine protease (ClpP class)